MLPLPLPLPLPLMLPLLLPPMLPLLLPPMLPLPLLPMLPLPLLLPPMLPLPLLPLPMLLLPLPLPLLLPLFCFPLPNQRLSSSNSLLLTLPCPQYSKTPSSSTSSPNHQRPRHEFKHPSQDRQPFQSSAASTGLHACALRLGRFAHNVHKCKSKLLHVLLKECNLKVVSSTPKDCSPGDNTRQTILMNSSWKNSSMKIGH
ncbi:hypothetical protein K503DRAFT_248924 [Rhizopogon vinicolor AM-OR11-026]|uniref:Uncharacterized protein n=1 Tax=Rhizopogon vinicolor AM-OR11-026 TaxID=1314800 RepID=A0A1B7MX65_9AGAM|nr:hypothetical protein K503DRAFT_248924 [Rhizopogon vinicolor AM-OR11-026]